MPQADNVEEGYTVRKMQIVSSIIRRHLVFKYVEHAVKQAKSVE